MHSWSTSTISKPTLQSRSTQHWYSLHAVLNLTSAPEGSGRGGAWTQNPIQARWRKENQTQLSLSTAEVLNSSHLPLVIWTEVGRVGSIIMDCSCPPITPQCRQQPWPLPWGRSEGNSEHFLRATLSFYLMMSGVKAAASNGEWEFMLQAPSHCVPKRLFSGVI